MNNTSWYQRNRARVIARISAYRQEHPDSVKQWQATYRARHRDAERTRLRRHYAELSTPQRDALRAYQRAYVKQRKAVDPAYRVACALRKRISHALKRAAITTQEPRTRTRAKDLLGCTFVAYKAYLEQLFEPGMTWANYGNRPGQWSIDHIKPCAQFDLTETAQQRLCFHYTNTRPCWAELNMSKGAR